MARLLVLAVIFAALAYLARRREPEPRWYIDGGTWTTLNDTWTANR